MNATTESMLDSLTASIKTLSDEAPRFNGICRLVNDGASETADIVCETLRAENKRLGDETRRLQSLLDETTRLHETETSSLQSVIADKETAMADMNRRAVEKEAALEAENLRLRNSVGNASTASCRELKEIYVDAAVRLREAAACEFLEECDSAAPTDVIDSMHSRIRNSVESLFTSIAQLDSEMTTISGLADRFHSLIASKITDKPLADIARWYAYSQLPFMLDNDREEGRRVIASEITRFYNALTSLLSLAGFSYQIPRLFVENVYEGDYDNVTGSEQMNLDYQCPNVMTHASHVDRADHSATIVDIVEVGYFDRGRLVRKSKVIV